MYELPTSIDIQGTPFEIRDKGDFRTVFSCFEVLNDDDPELTLEDKVLTCLSIFYKAFEDVDYLLSFDHLEEAIEKMVDFFNMGQKNVSNTQSVNLIDWKTDETLICSAINTTIGKDIRSEKYIHWWTFISYYMGIGECTLSHIVAIRYKLYHGQKLEKHERQFRMDNPQYFEVDFRTQSQKALDEEILKQWNGAT